MSHEEHRLQTIQLIMGTLEASVECDQLVNKLADTKIISTSDVTRITDTEEKDRIKTIFEVLMGKGKEDLHPLALKILESQTSPSQQNTRNTEQAIERVVQGTDTSTVAARSFNGRRILKYSDLSNDWELKNFLVDLSEEIGEKEMEAMKYIMRGENGFGDAVLEKLTSPLKFFEKMTQSRLIDAYNLHFLQALLWRIKRRDLNEKIRQFCLESDKKPINFFLPAEHPENGYKYVKFHVEGDIDKLTHADKEHLRADVARILCVPITYVFIRGLEPAKSLLFTFMVPEEDVSSFIHIYHSQEASFVHLSIHVQINETELSLSEIALTTEQEEKPMYGQLKHLLEQKQSLKTQLADRDEQLLDLQDELDRREGDSTVDQVLHDDGALNAQQLHQQYELFKDMFYRIMDVMKTMKPRENVTDSNGKIGSLKLSSASALYRRLLSQARQRCETLDIDLLNKLLDAKTTLEATLHEERLRKMQEVIVMLSEHVEEQAEMIANLQASSNIAGASSTFLHDILAIQEQARNHATKQHQDETPKLEFNGIIGMKVVKLIYQAPHQIGIHPELQSILTSLTKELTNKERNKLKKFLCFSEAETEQLKQSPDMLLELAFLRELRKGRQEGPMEIVGDILAKIRKRTLVQQYLYPEQQPKLTKRPSSEKRGGPGRSSRSDTPQRKRKESGGFNA
ncbi:uncharacterized protein LOC124138272 isoform X2 [Haliotis rufescens]|nr:uncharacterized protein LOC124138272 isoform X2 [Haliotis rufescens]XP_046360790.2 uncharacterized protein LOC124138272 isoform X2 [Haliotis rufescens]